MPQTSGTLLTDNLTFAAMLLGTVLLVGALSFMPAVVLGPVADHLIDDRTVTVGSSPATASSIPGLSGIIFNRKQAYEC